MAISTIQTPSTVALTQSPVALSFLEQGDEITSQSYQYILELKYYMGNDSADTLTSGSTYTLEKYPNQNGYGIFDIGRILNSQFQQPAEYDGPQTLFYAASIYGRWQENGVFVTGSSFNVFSNKAALDGYQLFGEQVNESVTNQLEYVYWPLMTDGPATQSFQLGTAGNMNVWSNTNNDSLKYESNLGTYYVPLDNTASGSYTTIQDMPIGTNSQTFPDELDNDNLEWFAVSPSSGSVSTSPSIRFEAKCPTKYELIRIKWKNRYGAFDYFLFDLVSRKSFTTKTQQYQPQLGTWGGTFLGYAYYDTAKQNYTTDAYESISVNSDYVSEDYNNIFKQLLVSDEIYFVDYTPTYPQGFLRPLTIKSSNVTFKTQKVDKLIQYQFEFEYGQGYKLQF